MSDSDRSSFKGFTEAEVRHIPPTQAVNSTGVTVSPVGSSGLEPPMQTPSSSRQASAANTPAHARHSRSRSCALGLSDQIRQILRAELRRGRDRRHRSSSYHRSSSSSEGSSDSQSSPRSDRSQSYNRHHRHTRPSRSPRHSRHDRSRRSISRAPSHHACSNCLCSPRRHVRSRDHAMSRSPPHLERACPFQRPSCTVSVAVMQPGFYDSETNDPPTF